MQFHKSQCRREQILGQRSFAAGGLPEKTAGIALTSLLLVKSRV